MVAEPQDKNDVKTGSTKIRVELPLPLDVVSSVLGALAIQYPDGVIDMTDSTGLTMTIPHDSRCKTKASARKIRAAKTYLESEVETTILGFKPDGTLRAEAEKTIAVTLAVACRAAFQDNPEAKNFLQFRVRGDGSEAYTITAVRQHGKTPAELLTEARAEIARLDAIIAGGVA